MVGWLDKFNEITFEGEVEVSWMDLLMVKVVVNVIFVVILIMSPDVAADIAELSSASDAHRYTVPEYVGMALTVTAAGVDAPFV